MRTWFIAVLAVFLGLAGKRLLGGAGPVETFALTLEAGDVRGSYNGKSVGGQELESSSEGPSVRFNDERAQGLPFTVTSEAAADAGRQVPWSVELVRDEKYLHEAVCGAFDLEPCGLGAFLRQDDEEAHEPAVYMDFINAFAGPNSDKAMARLVQLDRLVDGFKLDPIVVLVTHEPRSKSANLNLIRVHLGHQGVVMGGFGGTTRIEQTGGGRRFVSKAALQGQTYPLPLPDGFNEYPYFSSPSGRMDMRLVPEATAWWCEAAGELIPPRPK